MNLSPLFKTQKTLDDKIVAEKGLEGQDLLDKKILALQVELGELANEWEMFKFWKVDPKPNTSFPNMKPCESCKGSGYEVNEEVFGGEECNNCGGRGAYAVGRKNPLLEEYVDCLHFILSIGNEIRFNHERWIIETEKTDDIILQFKEINRCVIEVDESQSTFEFVGLIQHFIGLGEQLGFTWQQIETAYYDKNKVNHERQNNGY